MTAYERAVLSIIANLKEYAGWYKIEVRLSNLVLSELEYLPDTLSRLLGKGYIEEGTETPEKYRVTASGEAALRNEV